MLKQKNMMVTDTPMTDLDVANIDTLQQRLRFSKRRVEAHAAVLVAITQEADPKVLLTRRSAFMNHHAGEVSFPGGKREAGDTSNIVVALREAQEETALNPFDVDLVGDLPIQKSKAGLLVRPVVGLISPEVNLIPQPTEIDRIFFASLQHLLHSQPQPYPVQFREQTLFFPSLHVEGEVVWGLTARVLINLFRYGFGQDKEWPLLMNRP